MAARWIAAMAAALLLPTAWLATQERGGADPARETFGRTAVEVAQGKELSLRWRMIAWSDEGAARMRADPALRERMNQTLPVALQSQLVTPVALMAAGRKLAPDTYRIGVAMDEGGAYSLSILLDQQYVRLPLELVETEQHFPYLTFSLLPAPEGGYALVVQWGSEYGRLVLGLAR